MLVKEYISNFAEELSLMYDQREANNIANYVVEELFGKLFIKADHILEPSRIEQLNDIKKRLLMHEPVQYVLGEAWFYGYKFKVDRSVLIPRPETEELVENIIKENKIPSPKILEIGTGSGCIPIMLKKQIPAADVFTIEISSDAINIAKQNAVDLDAHIQIIQADILQFEDFTFSLPQFDIIVSNPPYVDPLEKHTLHKNVLDFEPALALFAQENNPLIFYKKIAEFSFIHLNNNGKLYFEIPENKANEISIIIRDNEFSYTTVFNDMQEKQRFICATKG